MYICTAALGMRPSVYTQFGLNSYIIDYTGGREGEHGGEKKKQTYGIVRETFDQTDG